MGKYQQHLFNIYQISVQWAQLNLCPCGYSWFQNAVPSPPTALGQQQSGVRRVRGKSPAPSLFVEGMVWPISQSPLGLVLQIPRCDLDTHFPHHAVCLPRHLTLPWQRFLGSPLNKPLVFMSLLLGKPT